MATTAKKASAKKATAKKATAKPATRKAKSIRSADLAKLTQAAVRATTNKPTKIIKEPIWGFVLDTAAGALEAATAVTTRLSENAGASGLNLRAEPSVLLQRGRIIAGYIQRELNLPVRF